MPGSKKTDVSSRNFVLVLDLRAKHGREIHLVIFLNNTCCPGWTRHCHILYLRLKKKKKGGSSCEIDSEMTFLCLEHSDSPGCTVSTLDLFSHPWPHAPVTRDNSITTDSNYPPVHRSQDETVLKKSRLVLASLKFIKTK